MKWCDSKVYPYYLAKKDDKRLLKKNLYQQFIDHFRFDEVSIYCRPHNLKRLLAGSRYYNSGTKYDTSNKNDWLDHPRVFKSTKYNSVVLVSQPYNYDEKELSSFCKKLDFKYRVFGKSRSFYNPGQTYLIMIWSDNSLDNQANTLGGMTK
jgi:hypothetical protein